MGFGSATYGFRDSEAQETKLDNVIKSCFGNALNVFEICGTGKAIFSSVIYLVENIL